MDTTLMRDSQVGDQWIREVCAANPVTKVLNEQGQWNGNILTGPVRLAFCDALFEAKPQMRSDPNSKLKFSTAVLFPPPSLVNLSVLYGEYNRICASDFVHLWNGQYYNVDNPFGDQASKAHQYSGYTPGSTFLNISSNYKPAIVDVRMNPITDQSKVYAGAWAIACVNAYASGKNTPRKGPRFGLVQLMMIADDKPLSGGAPDPRQSFAGVAVKPPVSVSGAGFGQAPPPSGPQGAPQAGAYYPPATGAPPPGYQPPTGGFQPTTPPPGAAPQPAYDPEAEELRRIMGG